MVVDESTLTALLKRAAAEHPSRPALSVPGKLHLTHRRLDELVDQAADVLVAAGVGHGDVVALTFPNTPEFVIAFLGVIRARVTATPLNPAYTADEFTFYLSDSESKLLLTSDSGHPAAESAAAKLSIPTAAVYLPDPDSPLSISLPGTNEPAGAEIANDPADVALFLHASGTTSRPKGVPLTQLNLAASVANIRSAYRLAPSDSALLVLPLFHVHGLLAGLLAPLAAASAVALPAAGRFSASSFWPDMLAASATWFTAVPTVHRILLDRHDAAVSAGESIVYPKLRFVRSCSAALTPAVMERMEAAFGAPVVEAYAMTEAAHLMSTNPLPSDGPRRAGSVGMPVGQEMAVLDGDGARLPVGQAGEVCIRGPNVTGGYKGNPEANGSAFRFGWFHTGDIGYLDADGYLHLVGRIKELINRGGEKISPIEVDAVLLTHTDVLEAVAFGVPDDKYGEEINCAVIPKTGVELSEADLLSYCRKNLASFKVPKRVFIADSLPKTATGKVQRRIVAEHFLSKISAAKVPKSLVSWSFMEEGS